MKERLTGAIILVALIVLLVPELLSGPGPAPAPQAAVSSSEDPPLRSYTINLADESHATATSGSTGNVSPQSSDPVQPTTIAESPTAQQTPAGSATQSSSAQAQNSVQPTPPTAMASPQRRAPPPHEQRPAAAKTAPTGEWMVQLGVFRNHANAERLARQLKAQGFHALVSESGSGGHLLWRVRSGPVAERASAEQLSARLRTAGHIGGSVVPQ